MNGRKEGYMVKNLKNRDRKYSTVTQCQGKNNIRHYNKSKIIIRKFQNRWVGLTHPCCRYYRARQFAKQKDDHPEPSFPTGFGILVYVDCIWIFTIHLLHVP